MPGGREGESTRPIGRAGEIAAASRLLAASPPRHLLVSAGPALGATSFARHVAHATRRPVLAVRADHASRSVDLGALAPLVVAVDAPLGDGPEALVRATRRLVTDPTSPPVVVVDGAEHLDPRSALVLGHATELGATLVLTTARGAQLPAALAALRRDVGLADVVLGPVDDTAVARLAADVLGGPVEPALVRALTRTVGGAPAAIHDVLRAARHDGSVALAGAVWRQVSTLPLPASVVARVDAVLDPLDPDALTAVDLLALGGTVPLAPLERLVAGRHLDELEARGILAHEMVDGDQRLVLADPVVRAVRLRALPEVRLRRLARDLGATLGAVAAAGSPTNGATDQGPRAPRPADRLLAATLALRGGAALGREDGLEAARVALNRGEIDLAERLCRSILEAHPDPETAIFLGELLTTLGRSQEAERLLAAVAVERPDHLALVTGTRAVNLGHHLEEVERAVALIDDAVAELGDSPWAAELIGLHGVLLLMLGRPIEAVARVEPYLAETAGRHFVEAATAAGPALVVLGRHLDAAELAGRAFDERLRLGDQLMLASHGLHALIRSFALAAAGSFEEADMLAELVMAGAVDLGDRDGQMWAGIMTGRSLLDQGRFDEALVAFEAAAAAATDVNLVPHLGWARGGALLAAAQMADAVATRQALDALDACPPTRFALMAPDLTRARAWAEVATGDLNAATALLAAAADQSRATGQSGLELLALHDLVRLGRTDRVGRLVEVGAAVQGDLPAARVEHGAALVAGDAARLAAVSERFEQIGAIVLAAEAANHASWTYRRAHDRGLADRTRARVLQLRAQRPRAVTPALDLQPGAAELTAREREVVGLAAAGTPSKEIAARLGVSVRTVDNLLQRAYRKLGVSGRDALRDGRGGEGLGVLTSPR